MKVEDISDHAPPRNSVNPPSAEDPPRIDVAEDNTEAVIETGKRLKAIEDQRGKLKALEVDAAVQEWDKDRRARQEEIKEVVDGVELPVMTVSPRSIALSRPA